MQVMAVDAKGKGLGIVPMERAIHLILRKLARVVRWFDDKVLWMGPVEIVNAVFPEDVRDGVVIRQTTAVIKAPAVIQLMTFLKFGRRVTPAPTTRNVAARDNYRCQNSRCGKSFKHDPHRLTKDHIIPLSRGGKNTWENITTLCDRCNSRKGSHTLEELDWTLLSQPRVPETHLEVQIARVKCLPDEWQAILNNE